jgi:hypothetical protein
MSLSPLTFSLHLGLPIGGSLHPAGQTQFSSHRPSCLGWSLFIQQQSLSFNHLRQVTSAFPTSVILSRPRDTSSKCWSVSWFQLVGEDEGLTSLGTAGNPESNMARPKATIFFSISMQLGALLSGSLSLCGYTKIKMEVVESQANLHTPGRPRFPTLCSQLLLEGNRHVAWPRLQWLMLCFLSAKNFG